MKLTLARQYIISRLENELPQNLYYHSLNHVLDVEKAAIRIADGENITPTERELLLTAVAFHDAGFIYQSTNHEERGCVIAREVLHQFDYTAQEIELICGMIMATKIPQSPKTLLEQIICDADLDYLGRDDFWKIGNYLFQELSVYGILSDEKEWNKLQYKFLHSHQYFTQTAINLRQQNKMKHYEAVQKIINTY